MTTDGSAPLVLVADDDDDIRKAIVDVLLEEGYRVLEARDGTEALSLARSSSPDAMVIDHRMPGRLGADVLRDLRAEGVTVPAVFMTAGRDAQPLELGLECFLGKPFGIDALLEAVQRVLGTRR